MTIKKRSNTFSSLKKKKIAENRATKKENIVDSDLEKENDEIGLSGLSTSLPKIEETKTNGLYEGDEFVETDRSLDGSDFFNEKEGESEKKEDIYDFLFQDDEEKENNENEEILSNDLSDYIEVGEDELEYDDKKIFGEPQSKKEEQEDEEQTNDLNFDEDEDQQVEEELNFEDDSNEENYSEGELNFDNFQEEDEIEKDKLENQVDEDDNDNGDQNELMFDEEKEENQLDFDEFDNQSYNYYGNQEEDNNVEHNELSFEDDQLDNEKEEEHNELSFDEEEQFEEQDDENNDELSFENEDDEVENKLDYETIENEDNQDEEQINFEEFESQEEEIENQEDNNEKIEENQFYENEEDEEEITFNEEEEKINEIEEKKKELEELRKNSEQVETNKELEEQYENGEMNYTEDEIDSLLGDGEDQEENIGKLEEQKETKVESVMNTFQNVDKKEGGDNKKKIIYGVIGLLVIGIVGAGFIFKDKLMSLLGNQSEPKIEVVNETTGEVLQNEGNKVDNELSEEDKVKISIKEKEIEETNVSVENVKYVKEKISSLFPFYEIGSNSKTNLEGYITSTFPDNEELISSIQKISNKNFKNMTAFKFGFKIEELSAKDISKKMLLEGEKGKNAIKILKQIYQITTGKKIDKKYEGKSGEKNFVKMITKNLSMNQPFLEQTNAELKNAATKSNKYLLLLNDPKTKEYVSLKELFLKERKIAEELLGQDKIVYFDKFIDVSGRSDFNLEQDIKITQELLKRIKKSKQISSLLKKEDEKEIQKSIKSSKKLLKQYNLLNEIQFYHNYLQAIKKT